MVAQNIPKGSVSGGLRIFQMGRSSGGGGGGVVNPWISGKNWTERGGASLAPLHLRTFSSSRTLSRILDTLLISKVPGKVAERIFNNWINVRKLFWVSWKNLRSPIGYFNEDFNLWNHLWNLVYLRCHSHCCKFVMAYWLSGRIRHSCCVLLILL